jgi:indole-3-glycerol phosphate synthase
MQTRLEQPGVIRTGGILDRIVDAKTERLARSKTARPLDELITRVADSAHRATRAAFAKALQSTGRTNVIAEIKQRSPSKGVIREDFDPVELAKDYVAGNAAALSILCEEDFFGGSLSHLEAVRGYVSIPLLRKDFIFDSYQVYEAAAAGADAILLIVALLDDSILTDLICLAGELGLDALVEVHTAGEMERAGSAGASVIGVNNRDLRTFDTDLATSLRLRPLAPEGTILVSESGINTGADIQSLKSAGFDAFLIGEHLMRSPSPGGALKALLHQIADDSEGSGECQE